MNGDRPAPSTLRWGDLDVSASYAKLRDLTVHVLQVGHADTAVLLVHSVPSHAHAWLPIVARMRPGWYICPDLRGHGSSDWTRDGYWLADYADDLEQLCDRLGVTSAHVVGASLGGRIATLLAPRLGDRLRTLVLLDSAPSYSPAAVQRVQSIRAGNVTTSAFTDHDEIRRFWAEQHPDWDPEAIAVRADFMYRRNWAGRLVVRTDPEVGHMFGRAARVEEEAAWSALRATTARTVLVRGADSYLVDRELAERVCAAAPAGELHEVPGGHYLTYEDPARTAAVLDDIIGPPMAGDREERA